MKALCSLWLQYLPPLIPFVRILSTYFILITPFLFPLAIVFLYLLAVGFDLPYYSPSSLFLSTYPPSGSLPFVGL